MIDLKIIIRNLIRNPVFGVVIISGFTVSLAIALLLASYLFNETHYDKSFPLVKRIYRLCAEKGITTFRGDKAIEFKERYPEIERICRYDNESAEIVYARAPFAITNLVRTDNDFFKIFSVKIRSGRTEDPLPDNNSLAISSSLARTIFGSSDPVGQTINVQHRKDYTISAVYEDMPENSSIRSQAIISWENVNDIGGEWRNGIFYSRLFFLLNEKSDPVKLEEKITLDYMQDHYMKQPFRLLPFKKSYMSPMTIDKTSQTLHADLLSILLFSVVTVLILVISILNFIILFTSNHLARTKEIGIKKVNGAGRKELFIQFIFEAVVISFIAFVLGIYLAFLLEAPFTSLIQKDFPVLIALHFPNILLVLLGVVIVGFVAGFYPAVIISGFTPVSIFGNFTVRGRLQMKSGLSVVQYLISIVLIVSLIVMTRQNSLLTNKDLGFTKEQLILIKIPWEVKDKLTVVKGKLLSSPYIRSCTVSHGIPGRLSLWGMWSEAYEKYGYKGNLPYFTVDPDFFKVYDAEFVLGRDFEEGDWKKSVIINEAALKLTGWQTIEGKVLKGIPTPEQSFGKGSKSDIEKNSLNIVGVIKDINVEKLNQQVSPTIFECSDNFGVSFMTCRVLPGDYSGVIDYMKNTWNEVCPEFVFEYQFYDEWIDSLYKTEMHSAFIIRVFAILSIILTCLGTFGIIHFISRQKTRETGIRKVHGAKITDILKILSWSVLRWIVIASVIAIPLSYFIMKRYLHGFAFKTTLSWWIFALAGTIALGIALLTIIWQSWRAAMRNPVEALRYE